jgi:hypothetical protein
MAITAVLSERRHARRRQVRAIAISSHHPDDRRWPGPACSDDPTGRPAGLVARRASVGPVVLLAAAAAGDGLHCTRASHQPIEATPWRVVLVAPIRAHQDHRRVSSDVLVVALRSIARRGGARDDAGRCGRGTAGPGRRGNGMMRGDRRGQWPWVTTPAAPRR